MISEGKQKESDDVAAIADLLDSEIARCESQQERAGWTPWALTATWATLIWILLAELEKGAVSIAISLVLWSILVYGYQAVKFWDGFLRDEGHGLPGAPRFKLLNQDVGSQRPLIFIVIIKQVTALYLLWGYLSGGSTLDKVITYSYLGFDLLATLTTFALSWLELPMPNSTGKLKPLGRIIVGVIMFMASWTALSLLFSYWSGLGSNVFQALRIALLVFAIIEVFEYLIAVKSKEPMLPLLISIKREFSLGNISASSAKSHLEVAVLGMKVGDIMRPTVTNFITLMEQAESKAKSVAAQLARMLDIAAQNAKSLTDENREVLSTRAKVVDTTSGELRDCLARVKKVIEKFNTGIGILKVLNSECAPDAEALKAEMIKSVERFNSALRESTEQLDKLKALAASENLSLPPLNPPRL